jgi:hypothetical protein
MSAAEELRAALDVLASERIQPSSKGGSDG